MANHDSVAVFILTNRRPDRVMTYNTLRQAGWTKNIYLIVDNEDPTADEYREKFGEKWVIEFDKEAIAQEFDPADTLGEKRTITHARNASWRIAKQLGLDYHIQLDDDYTSFGYRYIEEDRLIQRPIKSMDQVIDAMMTFMDISGASAVALSQGGDHLGGVNGGFNSKIKRKAMNSFILRTDRQFDFIGTMNEDVNTYVTNGMRGKLFFTIMSILLTQVQTQTSAGGITEMYKSHGTYTKSFYTVMMSPSSVKIRAMGHSHQRLHHSIRWDHTVPKIISDRNKKR